MLKTMRFSLTFRNLRGLLAGLCLFVLVAAKADAQSSTTGEQFSRVTLTPAVVVAGSPELIRVEATDAASVNGEWMGRKLEFFRGSKGSLSLIHISEPTRRT